MVVEIENNNWQSEVINSNIPVVVDFWAEWCGPCKTLSPILDALSHEFEGKLKIVKVNIEKHQNLVEQFSVRSVPTLVVIKEGQEKDRIVGLTKRSLLSEKLQAHL